MKITHGWYEDDPKAKVFKELPTYIIELSTSEYWELQMILSLFLQSRAKNGYTCGVEFVENLLRQLKNNPNPSIPFYKKQLEELRKEMKELRENL